MKAVSHCSNMQHIILQGNSAVVTLVGYQMYRVYTISQYTDHLLMFKHCGQYSHVDKEKIANRKFMQCCAVCQRSRYNKNG